ncbi:diacylglycerol acyltransferase-domain-containing protein [Baffinella frigidus]|nr:diacylglycerol acyltransferase-domain-containing protein [Cryptophyta sp. CCMP2293]
MAAGDSAMPAGEDHTEDSVAGGGGQWRMLSGISIFDAVALFCSGLFIVPVCFCTAVLLLWNIYTFPLIAAYLVFMLVDKAPVTGSRKSGHFRRWTMFTLFKDFFPITLHKTADLDPDGKYVIGYHPHGISALLPGLNFFLCTLPINFRVPFLREVWLWMGMCDSSKHSFRNILSRGSGTVVVVVVGGAAEALQAAPGTMDLVRMLS